MNQKLVIKQKLGIKIVRQQKAMQRKPLPMCHKTTHQKSGYILVLTIMIISLAVALVTAVVQQTFSYQRSIRLARDKAHARLLVFSSLELALSQLSLVMPPEDKEKETAGQKPSQASGQQKSPSDQSKNEKKEEVLLPLQRWLLKIVPHLNRWQKIDLSDEIGEAGTVNLYIAAEQGKINLNDLEEPSAGGQQSGSKNGIKPGNQMSGPPGQDALQNQQNPAQQQGEQAQAGGRNGRGFGQQPKKGALLAVDSLLRQHAGGGQSSLKESLLAFRKQFQRIPEDATELLQMSQFSAFKDKVFVSKEETRKPLFIMDLFTQRQEKKKLNPLLFSSSVKTLLGITEKDAKVSRELIKKIQPSMNWATQWDAILAPRYGKKYAQLDKDIADLFATQFEANAFSVVSYCTVGTVTQKVYALLELTKPGSDLSSKSLIFRVVKLYWL